MSLTKYRFIEEALAERKQDKRLRTLTVYDPAGPATVQYDGRELCNMSGNDYLGLTGHMDVINRAKEFTDRFGAGSAASRLVSGTFSIHEELEDKIASTFEWEASLLFNSGFQANSTIISTLADRHSLILADKLSHNSLLQGAISCRAAFRRFDHNSIQDLRQHLERAREESFSRIFVVTESLYSMDGDRSDLQSIAELADKYNAWLFVDDAHAVGVWGDKGLGLAHGIPGVDMVLGTCGKAFGAFGAFLLCSSKTREYLINFCPGFIYTTALPPAVIGAIEASLELIPALTEERKLLKKRIKRVGTHLRELGFDTGNSISQIIPLIVGSDAAALDLAAFLLSNGYLATAIRPPTVPEGSARIRITLSSAHSEEKIDRFLDLLAEWKHE